MSILQMVFDQKRCKLYLMTEIMKRNYLAKVNLAFSKQLDLKAQTMQVRREF